MSGKAGSTTGQQRRSGTVPTKNNTVASKSSISSTTLLLAAALGLTSIVLAATMKLPAFKFLLPFLPLALGNNGGSGSRGAVGYTGLPGAGLDATNDGIKEYTLTADGIKATFIGHGARMTHLYVNDRQGTPRDVVVGYDTPEQYLAETKPSYLGPVVGRFANRIKNGTFEIDNQKYQVPNNEHDGLNSLHGGDFGYDRRNWTVVQSNASSVTFSLFDPSGFQGFPGSVVTYATYTLSSPARLTSRLISISLDQKTPIMLANHFAWNLGSFTKPTVLDDTLHLPYAKRSIATDGIQIPTGEIDSLVHPWQSPPVPLNFTSPKRVGDGSQYSKQCGTGCTGIDNAFIFDRPAYYSSQDSLEPYALKWNSPDTGITMTMRTNQGGLQIYDCLGQAGTQPVKASQKGNGNDLIQKYGCLVIETQEWIDAINQPGWGIDDKVFSGPTDAPVVNFATYDFTVE